ncbi:MAG: phage portal protein [Ignavibacteriae bacterium]|nr:phage portal protein [Ignavibacteriota bacterium]
MEYTGYLQGMWASQLTRYASNWQLYNGETWLELEAGTDGQAPRRKYRLGVNDISLACNMHAQLLFGEVRDNSEPLIQQKVAPRRGFEVPNGIISAAQDYLDELWMESEARKVQFLAGLSSQVTGGVYWRIRYALENENPFDLFPFKFEMVHSDYVFPVFTPGSTTFSEIFVRYMIPREAARSEWGQWSGDWPELVEYREHWTAARGGNAGTLSITVGVEGKRLTIKAEKNPFGFLPFVYIPHVASNGFFGVPLAEWVGGVDLAYEYNARLANIGDILHQNSYPFGVLKNHPTGKLKLPFRLWRGGPAVVDLGPGMPDGKAPEMDWYSPSDVTSGAMNYIDSLKKELRMAMAIPPVAVGEDEGSQRSSLTLITRMFPVKSHILTERWLWTPAFEKLNRMALQMAILKQVGKLDGLDVSKIAITPAWAPMLPRDRTELVNELVQRQGVGHIHPMDALEKYEDIPTGEIEETFKRIQEFEEWKAELNKPPETPEGIPASKPKEAAKAKEEKDE